jgi:hypothetical protein
MSRKVLLKFLLASMKTVTNYGFFLQEAASKFAPHSPPPPHPPTRLAATQRELRASIQPLKMLTVNHPPVIKSNTVTCFKISPAYGTVYRIIGRFPYAATSSLRRVIGRCLQLVSVFIEASQNFIFYFLHNKAP